ncbi:MAG: formate dehydrogenase subunit alpha [Dehalococcoidia bacterium]|nr:formate dehydrogenase subunit alpha [Dehalococcoidia bacterium]
MEEITLTIDGTQVKAKKGQSVLGAAKHAGIYIPSLCADPELTAYGGCRVCVVEIDGVSGDLPTSCTTKAERGMVVQTNTPRVKETRKRIVDLIRRDHSDDCEMCPKNKNCELQKVTDYVGIQRYPVKKLAGITAPDWSNPFFLLDRQRCILCTKCIRTCKELVNVGALELVGNLNSARVVGLGNKPIAESPCISCGQCVDKCPTASLMEKVYRVPTKEVRTVCPYCGVGCGIKVGLYYDLISTTWGDKESPVNKGRLCVKGRFGIAEFVNHDDRLLSPLIKSEGRFSDASWDEALDHVTEKLAGYKGDQFALIASAKCTNEDNYIFQKFARVVMGTNNVDHCARLCHAPTVEGMIQSFGSGAMTSSISEIAGAKTLFAIGSNTTSSHPVIGQEVKLAARKGAKLIVANPREIDLCRFATVWLRHRPGTDVALVMGMARVIVDEGLADMQFVQERCENFDAFKASLAEFGLESVEKITGVPKDKIAEAARLYATQKPAITLFAMGITQHTTGTDNVLAISNLAMLTGNVGKPSAGVAPLRGHNNVQGSSDMGVLPNYYTGYQRVENAQVREKFEKAWGVKLSPRPGLTLTEIFTAALSGQIKAVYLIGENPVLSEPDANKTQKALESLEFLLVQDIFPTESGRPAHVVLPACSFAERDGTFTNTERRVQRVRKVIEPIGESRPDWWIVCQIAKKMGASGFDYQHPSEIMDEIASLTTIYGGIAYPRLEQVGLQWPCPTKDHPGTPFLHAQAFTRGKGHFSPLKDRPPAELPDESYPLILTTQRSLFQFHTGTMTRRVEGLETLRHEELVEMNPVDAANLGIADGDFVKVTSRRGEMVARARVNGVSPVGVVCTTFHFSESPTNRLTNSAVDPVSKIPELKVCAVRVEKTEPPSDLDL